MKDEESTQPIEIDALRDGLAKSPASAPHTQRQGPDFVTDEHPPIGDASDPSLVRETVRNAAIPTRRDPSANDDAGPVSSTRMERTPRVALSPGYPFEGEDENEEPSSVTRIDVAAPAVTPPSEPPASINTLSERPLPSPRHAPATQHSPALREPATLAAHDVAAALGRMMGDVPEDRAHEESETATRLPLPAFTLEEEEALAQQDPEITSVSRGSAHDVNEDAAEEAAYPAADPIEPPPDSSDMDMTRMQDLSRPAVQAAFAAAVAQETTAIFQGPIPSMARPTEEERRASQASISSIDIPISSAHSSGSVDISVSMDSFPDPAELAPAPNAPPSSKKELADVPDAEEGDDLARTGEDIGDSDYSVPIVRDPPPADLPRFALASFDDLSQPSENVVPPAEAKRLMLASEPDDSSSFERISQASPSLDLQIFSQQDSGEIETKSGHYAHDVETKSGQYTQDVETKTGHYSSEAHRDPLPSSIEGNLDDDFRATNDLRRDVLRETTLTREAREAAALGDQDEEEDETQYLRRNAEPQPAPPPQALLDDDDDAEPVEEAELIEFVQDIDTSAQAERPVPPPPPQWQAPPVASGPRPAYMSDPDADEEQLQREKSYSGLMDLYRIRLEEADTPAVKATILHKMASVHEHALSDPHAAFPLLVQGFELRPSDEDLVASLDRVGREVGRIGELADRTRKALHTTPDPEMKVVLLGHLVYWYERVLGRGGEISAFVSEIERLDKTHPIALRRAAQLAAANGDTKTQRELLLRALNRTVRSDEKVALHLTLAGAHAGTPEAVKHYEAALALEPTTIVALQGLERIGREQERYAQVEWSLERQSEVAPTAVERVEALLKLAELHESKFLKRESAALILERVIQLEPAHPQALPALERCYHALRDWAKLAPILRARAENTYDKKQRAELLELAAEVLESKLGDAAGAVEVLRDLLVADPKHRRAMNDLARLYEKLGDWGNVATYKARLAELAPTKRAASNELVKLGDFLAAPERDPIAARLQYEKALTIDATNALAWEGVQRMAAEAGDERRVIECLEMRAKHTDIPRQRAVVLVELAQFYQGRGDDRAARKAFEAAIKADSSNEIAAKAMLDAYSREERWGEAAPLCELLVNAAIRDRDGESLFVRLRLSTRISAALDDADRAMTSAIAALDARPNDPGAQADLVAVCAQCRDRPEIIHRAKDHLGRIAEAPAALPASMMLRLAQIQRDGGDPELAMRTLRAGLEREPDDRDLMSELAEMYLQQNDYVHACKLKVDLARNALTADAKFDLFIEAGEIWARRAHELERALSVFEEARRIKPLDSWLLHTLLWLYGELGEWDRLSDVLEDIAKIQETPDRKIKSLIAMANVVRDKLGDLQRAAELFDQVLELDKKRLDIFEELVRTLTEAKDWETLEVAYRRMIARIKDDEEQPQLKFALFHQLGLIYRDRLGDASRAFDALEAASRIQPDNAAVRKIVTELLVVTDNLDNAVARIRAQIDRVPHDASLYAELYELFLRQHFFDKAWCAINVFACIGQPNAEQRRFLEDYAPVPLSEVPGQIVEAAWRSHVFDPDLDPKLSTLFALVTPVVARMRHAQLRPEHAVGRPFTPKHSAMHDVIRAAFQNGAEILSMKAPELLLGDPKSMVPFAQALAPFGAIQVAVAAVEQRADSLVYMVGKRLAEQRPELQARAFFPSVPDLTTLLATAVRVSRNELAKDAAGIAQDNHFNQALQPHEREGIRAIVLQTQTEGGLVDVKRWSQAADLSSMRAGLLLCGDVEPAKKAIFTEPQSPSDLAPREKVGELFKFATSDLYSDLRGAIGVAVQA